MATRMRSPNYPATGLSEAIRLVRELWNKEKRTPVSAEVAVKAMGYKSLNGATRSHLSALRKYGLIEGGDGGIRVSELTMRIIHGSDGSEERQNALQEAALKPELFKELSQTHAEASDEALKSYLIVKRGFSEAGARQFIGAFRDTLALAKASGADYDTGKTRAGGGEMPEVTAERWTGGQQSTRPNIQVFSWPLSEGVLAEVRLTGERIRPSHLKLLRQYLELAETAVGIKDEQE